MNNTFSELEGVLETIDESSSIKALRAQAAQQDLENLDGSQERITDSYDLALIQMKAICEKGHEQIKRLIDLSKTQQVQLI